MQGIPAFCEGIKGYVSFRDTCSFEGILVPTKGYVFFALGMLRTRRDTKCPFEKNLRVKGYSLVLRMLCTIKDTKRYGVSLRKESFFLRAYPFEKIVCERIRVPSKGYLFQQRDTYPLLCEKIPCPFFYAQEKIPAKKSRVPSFTRKKR